MAGTYPRRGKYGPLDVFRGVGAKTPADQKSARSGPCAGAISHKGTRRSHGESATPGLGRTKPPACVMKGPGWGA